MAHIPDSKIEPSDPPIHPRKVPAIVDLRRAVGIIAVVLALVLLVAGLGRLFASSDDPYLPESRNATGANAPAIPVPPAR
ncbi:hypothetical protein [Pulveribacter sp.]|uniref:hypothetical protein n=1 Tax=Pulveribacter sp. TaxID=2678893 RepID=UPI00289A3F80|nr:hypothetical protein [Pulveribacter sp.]